MLREQLEALGWSQTRLGQMLDCDGRTIRNWVAEDRTPEPVAKWLDACLAHRRHHPDPSAPEAWAWQAGETTTGLSRVELMEMIGRVGLSQQGFARQVGSNPLAVSEWLAGKRPFPLLLAKWLRQVALHRDRHPLPDPPPPSTWRFTRERV